MRSAYEIGCLERDCSNRKVTGQARCRLVKSFCEKCRNGKSKEFVLRASKNRKRAVRFENCFELFVTVAVDEDGKIQSLSHTSV